MARKRRKLKRRIDRFEYGVPVWTTEPEPKKQRLVSVVPKRFAVGGKVTVYADIIRDSEKAFLTRIDGEIMWIAKSLLPASEQVLIAEGDTLAEMTIPEWLARENHLI